MPTIDILQRIRVRAVDHDARRQPGLGQCPFRQFHAHSVVIGPAATAAQHEVTVGIAAGADDRGAAIGVDPEEAVGVRCRLDGIDRDLEPAVGAVLEADRRRQAAGHFAVRPSCTSRRRAATMPSSMRKESSMRGSLM